METILLIFDIMGTLAFAVSGALVGIRRRMDIFGVAVLAVVTATGGGILRDLVIGHVPPEAFRNPMYVGIATGAGLLCFLVLYFRPQLPEKLAKTYDVLMFWFDTFGVAAFTVGGAAAAITFGYRGNLFLLVFLGVITGVGGGMIRDVLASVVPEVLKKHVYALASILGALVFGILEVCGVDDQIGMICGFVVIVLLRFLAAHFRWNLPKVGNRWAKNARPEDKTDAPDQDAKETD